MFSVDYIPKALFRKLTVIEISISFTGHFTWDKYLKETCSVPAPVHCFKQVIDSQHL